MDRTLPIAIVMTVLFTTAFAAAPEHPPVAGLVKAECIGCHADVMTRPVMHGPVAAGDCAACHSVDNTPGRRRIALKTGTSGGDTSALCISCHQENAERLKQAHRHAPVAAGQCTACHDPHGSRFRFQLAAEGSAACLRCHEDVAQALKQKNVHEPAAASCAVCHDAHSSSHPAQMKGDVNVVCLACHLENAAMRLAVEPRSLFAVPGAAPEALLTNAPHVALDRALRAGHPTIGHPVDARKDPAEPARTLRCTSCHNPHGTAGAKLLRFGAAGTSPLCVRCHTF